MLTPHCRSEAVFDDGLSLACSIRTSAFLNLFSFSARAGRPHFIVLQTGISACLYLLELRNGRATDSQCYCARCVLVGSTFNVHIDSMPFSWILHLPAHYSSEEEDNQQYRLRMW